MTIYEWKNGEPPLKIEEPPLNVKFEDEVDSTHADNNAVSMIVCLCKHLEIRLLKATDPTEQKFT